MVHTGKTSFRRSAIEIQRQQADEAQQQPDDSKAARSNSVAKPAAFRTFEEAVDASQLLAARPPVQPGESGTNTYLVQPTQLLSWYPRHAPTDHLAVSVPLYTRCSLLACQKQAAPLLAFRVVHPLGSICTERSR